MLLKITDLGLASCWIGAFYDEAVKRILGIPEEIEVEAIIPISKKPVFARESKRKNIDLKEIIHFDRYGQKIMKK